MRGTACIPVSKTPTANRSLFPVAVLVSLCSAVPPAWSLGVLTEAEIIRLARARAPGSAVANAVLGLAEARAQTALFPNPLVGWERETLLTGEDSVQDVFRATVPIDIARGLSARSLAASESAWMRAEASMMRTQAILEAVLAYCDLVVGKRTVEILEQSVTSLSEAARVLARREEAGVASGYESARLTIASELARSRLAEAQGALRAARARLAGLLDIDAAALRVDAALSLVLLPSEADLARSGADGRDDVKEARASARSAAEADERAAWTWVPALSLSGGANVVRELDTRRGYVLSLSLDVPLFDRGQAMRAQARARRAHSAAQSEALIRSVRIDVASAYAIYAIARAELERYEGAALNQVETLLEAAQSGYREGERTIVELLDAQRARTDVAERRLELLAAAKRAEVRARAAGGKLR